MNNRNTRGSEWHKWDLHIHTTSSYDYQDMGVTDEEFIKVLADNNVSAIAITDHHIIDIEKINNLRLIGKDYGISVFPGIEILSDARGKDPIHFIGIFSDEANITYIWSQLQAKTNISRIQGSGVEINEVYCDLVETISLIHELGGIVTIHAGKKSNSLENITHALPHGDAQKTDIASIVDIFEVGTEKDVSDYNSIVIPCIAKQIGKKHPVILCSDNHNIKDYHPKQNCWIKSELSFEGLKQILYEPEDRVFIGDSANKKNPHNIIDSIEFKDENFQKDKIYFNDNLNCIIGGKSTGKSILLRSIANAINSEHVEKQEAHYKYEKKQLSINDVNVIWKDGSSEERKIIYIPQTYLNNIVDDIQNDNPIKTIIEETLLQTENIQNAKRELIDKQNQIKEELRENVIKLCQTKTELVTIKEKLQILGSEDAYIKRICDLESQRNEIVLQGDVSVNDITNYEDKSRKIEALELDLKNDSTVQNNLSNIMAPIAFVPSWFEKDINGNYELSNKYFGRYDSYIRSKFEQLNKLLLNEWNTFKTSLISEIEKNKSDKENELDVLNKEFNSLSTKITINKKVQEFNVLIDNENRSLAEIKKLKETELQLEKDFSSFIKKVVDSRKCYRDAISNYCQIVNDSDKSSIGDLTFEAQTVWQKDNFIEGLASSLNQTYFSKFKENTNYDLRELSDSDYTDLFLENILDAITSTKKDCSLPLKASAILENVLIQIFGNWYTTHYLVKSGNDTIEVMSPGKKASVLLELLISKANKDCPILIDQPEDDLDNRSIFIDLAKYLRDKKKDRQIIIVTHNANLVIGADAEEIIIANQSGNDSINENARFEYRTGAIESLYSEPDSAGILYKKSIQEQICDILEGGVQAFETRKNKYNSINK